MNNHTVGYMQYIHGIAFDLHRQWHVDFECNFENIFTQELFKDLKI